MLLVGVVGCKTLQVPFAGAYLGHTRGRLEGLGTLNTKLKEPQPGALNLE